MIVEGRTLDPRRRFGGSPAHDPRRMISDVQPRRTPWVVAAAFAVAAVLLAAVMIARPAVTGPVGERPEVRVAVDQSRTNAIDFSQGTPTVTVSYADGTEGDAAAALTRPWTPDRPIVMLVVVAQLACSIEINGELADKRGAPINRLAVCVWTAPAAA